MGLYVLYYCHVMMPSSKLSFRDFLTSRPNSACIQTRKLGNGGGHINIGFASAFEGDALLLRNFIVDFANHPEMATGIFLHDWQNAKPIAGLSIEERKTFQNAVQALIAEKSRTSKNFFLDWMPHIGCLKTISSRDKDLTKEKP